MLEKIIKIENIKQWQHRKALDKDLGKLNLIYGRNGSGKSTLCSIFNHINQGNTQAIEALQPIESDKQQNLLLRFKGSGNVSLTSLQTPYTFHVYNQEFIDNNLYIRNSKDRSQLTNYYEFSLGSVSVEKEKQVEALKADIQSITNKLSPVESRLTTLFPSKTVAKIRAIKATPKADDEIASLKTQIEDLKGVEHFRKRSKLESLVFNRPTIDTDIFSISIDSVSKEATEKVEEHLKDNLEKRDISWIETGIELANEDGNCPLCAQPLSQSKVFSLYQEFLNDSYNQANEKFKLDCETFENDVRKITSLLELLEKSVDSNSLIITSWSDKIDSISLSFDFSYLKVLSSEVTNEALRLIEEKKKDILSSTNLDTFNQKLDKLFEYIDFSTYNKSVDDFNSKINDFLANLAVGSITTLQENIKVLEESTLRFSSDVVSDLDEHKKLLKDRKTKNDQMSEIRKEIAEEQQVSMGLHKNSINTILKSFNSMIRIKLLDTDNKGKGGTTRLKYVITFIDQELAIENVDDSQKLFEHVLSLGDRSALALAFFLSRFTNTNTDNSIIVLDDPMSSLDSFRKEATIIEIEKLINNDYQTIVFSHDPFFLSDIQKYSLLSKVSNCYEIDVNYTDKDPLNSEGSQFISSQLIEHKDFESHVMHSYYKEYNSLYDFVSSGKDESKVQAARSIRPILEAHLRFLYPREFGSNFWLGDMIKMIREETDQNSPFYDKHNRISQLQTINVFSKTFHHSDGFDTKIQSLDLQTVKGYAKETLQFITGI